MIGRALFFRGSRISKSSCLIRMRRDFKDRVVCSNYQIVLDHGGHLGMEARVFQRTNSGTMKILRKNNLHISLNQLKNITSIYT